MADETGDATRRTWLANERTWLAWVRTGLTATAVALATGKVVPELAGSSNTWPYALIGVGYGLLGVALVLYGFWRRAEVDRALASGEYVRPHGHVLTALAVATCVLGLGSVALVLVS